MYRGLSTFISDIRNGEWYPAALPLLARAPLCSGCS